MKQEVQLTSKALTATQRLLLRWLKNDGVKIVETDIKIIMTKFGLHIRQIKPPSLEAIKPFLLIESKTTTAWNTDKTVYRLAED